MLRRFVIAAGCGAALFLYAGAASAGESVVMPSGEVQVEGITVTASPNVRLTLALGGEMAPDQYVTSAPVGIHCQGAEYRYTTGVNHQCWLWVKRHEPVLLTAQGRGAYGSEWSVEWSGCEPVAGGPACLLTPRSETVVAAVFKRAPY